MPRYFQPQPRSYFSIFGILLFGVFGLMSGGCATTNAQKTSAEATVEMDEIHIRLKGKGPGGLDAYDAKALFDRGQDLLNGEAYKDAFPYFSRIVLEFPTSPYARGSQFSLGVCNLNLQKGEPALAAFDAFLASLDDDNPKHARLSRRGRFRKGAALALLKRYEEVAELYDILLVEDLSLAEEIEALTDSGIGHFMRGDPITAEYRFMKARRLWRQGSQVERLSVKFFVAQATFYLAELARQEYAEFRLLPADEARLEARRQRQVEAQKVLAEAEAQGKESVITAIDVDEVKPNELSRETDFRGEPGEVGESDDDSVAEYPTSTEQKIATAQKGEGDETLHDDAAPKVSIEELIGKQLEKKCQLLLRAQVSYLRVIREGHAGWASAAGYKVGTMYEDLYDEMISLPAPEDLTVDQRKLYHEVMHERIAILLRKAIGTWEATAQMATRTGSNNEWIEKTRLSLDRLRTFVEAGAANENEAKTPRQLDDDEVQS
ncbi:MAG: hypothetical protein GY822_22220 [Deltaproteobacteria bacterium]|nr:hypothetical protein [Deltaproteobacteria bacterium]